MFIGVGFFTLLLMTYFSAHCIYLICHLEDAKTKLYLTVKYA